MTGKPASSHKQSIEKAIREFPGLPPMSSFALQHLNDPEVNYKELAETVRYDPGVTADVLKLANSASFGLPREVKSLQHAFAMMGMRRIFKLLMANTALRWMNVDLPGYELDPQSFVRHSAWVAIAAEHLAERIGEPDTDTCFTCGLLHDLGKLPMDPFVHECKNELQTELNTENGESFDDVEEKVIGMNHSQAGAMLLENWQLPERIATVVRWHHDPDQAPKPDPITGLVHMADLLAYAEGIGAGLEGTHYRFAEKTMEAIGLTQGHLEYAASQTLDRMNELTRIFVKQP